MIRLKLHGNLLHSLIYGFTLIRRGLSPVVQKSMNISHNRAQQLIRLGVHRLGGFEFGMEAFQQFK